MNSFPEIASVPAIAAIVFSMIWQTAESSAKYGKTDPVRNHGQMKRRQQPANS